MYLMPLSFVSPNIFPSIFIAVQTGKADARKGKAFLDNLMICRERN